MKFLNPRRVGTRLTLWYVCLLAAVLAFSWGLTMVLLYWQSISQMDRYAIQDAETVEGLLYLVPGGGIGLHEDYHNHPESKLVLERLLEVRSVDGNVLYKNDRLGDRELGGAIQPGEGAGGYSPEPSNWSTAPRCGLSAADMFCKAGPFCFAWATAKKVFGRFWSACWEQPCWPCR